MKLTKSDIARLRCWKEGECCTQDHSRPGNTEHLEPMLPKVCFSIVARLMHQARTARGKLLRARRAIDLVLEALKADPLSVGCRKCWAPAGEKCKNYKGQNKQTCPERGA